MHRRTVIHRRRDLAPVDFEQVGLDHLSFL
jgi:hypothetical protein